MAMAMLGQGGEDLQRRIGELKTAQCELNAISARLDARNGVYGAEQFEALSSDLTQLFEILRRVGLQVPSLHHG